MDTKKTLTLGNKLSINKKVETDKVRQSFSHGRSKTVEVETKKKRVFNSSRSLSRSSKDTHLTGGEIETRVRAVQDAIKRELEQKELEAAKALAELEARKKLEALEKEQSSKDEEKSKEEAPKKVEEPSKVSNEKLTSILPEKEFEDKNVSFKKPKLSQIPRPKKSISIEDLGESVRFDAYKPAPKVEVSSPKPYHQKPFERDQRKAEEKPTEQKRDDQRQSRTYEKRPSQRPYEGRPKQNFQRPPQAQNRPDNRPHTRPAIATDAIQTPKPAVQIDQNKNKPLKKTKSFSDENQSKKQDKTDFKKLSKKNLNKVLQGNEDEKARSIAATKRARQKQKRQINQIDAPKVIREVAIPDSIIVLELANRMAVRAADVVKELMKLGMMVTINQTIDGDTAELICQELGHIPKRVSEESEFFIEDAVDLEESLIARPPVVTIMGHVDHGKTSLLDALRETDVVSLESGGITQHIGAYQVTISTGQKITFVDTPGHAAFSSMRARGANITDVVVLVVAADDGIKEQTVEAISHAKSANVPIVVAINKIDKPGADPSRVKSELLQHGLVVEEFGGDIISIEVSAKKKQNLEKLEEAILLQAEVLSLKANPNRVAKGVVIEARMDKGRGPVATVLIQKGTIKTGDVFVSGTEFGRVRVLVSDHGKTVSSASPACPIEIIGFNGVPLAGDDFNVVENEARAKEIAEYRLRKIKEKKNVATKTSLEKMMDQINQGEMKELPVVVKTDVQGSLEAIVSGLQKLGTAEVSVKVLYGGVGAINESDVTLAKASNGLIFGFNVRANAQAREISRRDDLDIRYYSIIYDLLDDARSMLGGLLSPTLKENFLGNAEVRAIFSTPKAGKVAGCFVNEGLIKRGCKVRLLRDAVVIYEGELKTLRRFKDEVKEVKDGYECGMAFENYQDLKEGDVIECFEIQEIARKI